MTANSHEPVFLEIEEYELLLKQGVQLPLGEIAVNEHFNAIFHGSSEKLGLYAIAFSAKVISLKEVTERAQAILYVETGNPDSSAGHRLRPLVATIENDGGLYRPGVVDKRSLNDERQKGFMTNVTVASESEHQLFPDEIQAILRSVNRR